MLHGRSRRTKSPTVLLGSTRDFHVDGSEGGAGGALSGAVASSFAFRFFRGLRDGSCAFAFPLPAFVTDAFGIAFEVSEQILDIRDQEKLESLVAQAELYANACSCKAQSAYICQWGRPGTVYQTDRQG